MWTGSYWSPSYWGDYWAQFGGSGGHGKVVGGKHAAYLSVMASQHYEQQEMVWRSIVQHMQERAATGLWLKKLEEDYQRKCLAWSAYSVLLSEV